MITMLRPADIAVLVQSAMNNKAIELYDSEEITDKLVFHVTADYQVYERLQKGEYELDNYQDITPVIISRTSHYEYPADYLRYQESYDIQVYGYADQLISLEKTLKEYTVEENTINKSVTITPFRVTKSQEDVSFGIDLDAMDGSLNKRVQGTASFTWSFLDGVMTSYDIIIKVDGEVLDYIDYEFLDSPKTIQSQVLDLAGQTSNTNANSFYAVSLQLPYISTSPVTKSLYRAFYDGSYNKKHTFEYYDTALNETFSFDVTVNRRHIKDTKPMISDFNIVLVRARKTVTIAIDDIEVPVMSYSITAQAQVDTTVQINSSTAQSAHLGDSYQLNMDIALDDTDNTKVTELFEKVINFDFGSPHLVTFTKGTTTKVYDCVLSSGAYNFDLEPEDRISIVLVEQDDLV